jgi:hypothetical protein
MSMPKCITVTLLSLLFILTVKSQSHFQAGKIVVNAGDTLSGEIDYGNWMVNPRTIHFRTGPGAGPKAYTVAGLRYFEVTGQDGYERGIVLKDMRPLASVGHPGEPFASGQDRIRDTAFLRILVQGPRLSLYELVDSKAHYYVSHEPGVYIELAYALLFNSDNSRIDESDGFRYQLKGYLTDTDEPGLGRKIDLAKYSEGNLAKIVVALNGQENANAPRKEKSQGSANVRFYGALGGGYGKLTLPGSVGDGAFYPAIYGGVDLARTRNYGDLVFRLEVGYYVTTYKGHGTDMYQTNYTYSVKESNISPSLSILYHFYRGQHLRLYAGVGAVFNVSSFSNGVVGVYQTGIPTPQNYEFSPQTFRFGLQFRVGAQVSNRFGVELLGGPPAQFNVYILPFTTGKISQFGLRASYYFGGAH